MQRGEERGRGRVGPGIAWMVTEFGGSRLVAVDRTSAVTGQPGKNGAQGHEAEMAGGCQG